MPVLLRLLLRSFTLTQLVRYLFSRQLRKHTDQQLREERADTDVRQLLLLQRGGDPERVELARLILDAIAIEEDRRGLRDVRLAKRAARAKARAEKRRGGP